MKHHVRYLGWTALASAAVIGSAPVGLALGFRNPDQSARATGQGEAFVAQADDASAIYYNPAGLTQVPGTQFTSGGLLGFPSWRYSGAGGSAEMNTPYMLPHLYGASDFGLERWRFGIGLNIPFGNSAEYSNTSVVRYTTTKSEMIVYNIAPTVAYQINENLSVGVALNVYYGTTEINRIAPLGTLLSLPLPDAPFRFDGDGASVGATLGVLWKINEQHALGFVYRAPFSIEYEGHAVIKNDLTGSFGRSRATAEIEYPQSIAVGYAFRPTPALKLEVDIEWTNWDTLNDVRLRSPNPGFDYKTNPTSIIPFHWENSFFYEFGAQYNVTTNWVLRTGYIYSENSVPSKTFSATIPDSDRHIFSVGVGFESKKFTVDLVYQYSLSDDRTVTGSPDNSLDGIGDADGLWKTEAHAVMITTSFRF